MRDLDNLDNKKHGWLAPLLGIGGGGLLALLVGWPSLAYPLGRDNGIFAYTGWAMLRGQVPYINFWEHKTPMIFFIYAAIMKLFGATEAGVRIGDLAYTLLVIPFLYLLVNELFGRRAAVCAALTWALFHTAVNTLYFWSGAESETFMVLPIILATYCYVRGERAAGKRQMAGWLLAAGFCGGLAVMIKVTALIGLSGLALYAILSKRREQTWGSWLRGLAGRIVLVLAGLLLAIMPFVLYFWLNHALAEAIDVSIVANIFYGGAGSSLLVAGGGLLDRIWGDLLGLHLYYVLPLIALIYIAGRERTRPALLITVWLAATFLMALIQGRLWPYHFIGTIVPLSILTGFIIDRALKWVESGQQIRFNGKMNAANGRSNEPTEVVAIKSRPTRDSGEEIRAATRLIGYVAIAVIVLGLAIWSLLPGNGTETFYSWDRYLQYQQGKITQRQYYADFHRGNYDYLPNRDAGEYIGAHTQPGQTALVWAVDPLVNLIAGRLAPGRFIYNYPIVAEEVPAAARDRYKQIFMAELKANPPQIIAVAEGDTSPITPQDSLALLVTFPEFGAVLTNDYRLVLEIPPSPNKGETFLIYERNKLTFLTQGGSKKGGPPPASMRC